jgi:hypothetical protein
MVVSSYHFLLGPLLAAGALGVILLLCRWTFAPPRRTAVRATPRRQDFGLLVPVTTVAAAEEAQALTALLRQAGIRATTSVDAHGVDLLVFREDALQARELVRR